MFDGWMFCKGRPRVLKNWPERCGSFQSQLKRIIYVRFFTMPSDLRHLSGLWLSWGFFLFAVQEIQKTCEHVGSLSNPWCLMVFILVQRFDISLELALCDGMQTGPTHQQLLLCCYPCEFWLLSQEFCLWHPEDKSRPILLTGFYGIIAGFARVKILVQKKLFFVNHSQSL